MNIATLSFTPTLIRYAVPAVTSYAYLQAKMTNTSEYPLLGSNKISVFIDGNFVATTSLTSATSPDESWIVFLGVDNSIKLQYLTRQITGGGSGSGWFSNSTQRRRQEDVMVVHNTNSTPIQMILVDILPLSTTATIEVWRM